MKAETGTGEQGGRTFTERARRAQIVTAAIETIDELGLARASFAKIAERAGLSSTGVISYHFASRDELIGEVLSQVYGAMTEYMTGRMSLGGTARQQLHAYIQGTIDFIATHRRQMKALLEIFLHGGVAYDAGTDEQVISPVEGILKRGQAQGEFRGFDAAVMAAVIQRAIDGLPFLLERRPEIAPASYAAELITTFDLATERQSQAGPEADRP